jgi:hypothetical protein
MEWLFLGNLTFHLYGSKNALLYFEADHLEAETEWTKN